MSEIDFDCKKRPFLSSPKADVYFPAESIENARKTSISVLERDAGIPLIFGKNGIGKSLLLKQIGKHFELDRSVVYIANPGLKTSKAFFQQLLYGIHQPYCNLDENELRLLLWNYLHQFETPDLLLLIDEAQTLNGKVLEELRILLDGNNENRSKIQVILAGTEAFEEKLTHPRLSAFGQHVIARSYLTPFNWNETENYIVWQMREAGEEIPETIFTPEASKTIHKLTEGVPRLVNQLGEESLHLAKSLRRKMIDEIIIQEAWAILQQMPMEPVTRAVEQEISFPATVDTESIEFGELSDDDYENDDFESRVTSPLYETTDSTATDAAELTMEHEPQKSAVLKIPQFSSGSQAQPCEDFLQKMRVMEATISRDLSPKNRSGSPRESAFHIPNVPAQKPRFF